MSGPRGRTRWHLAGLAILGATAMGSCVDGPLGPGDRFGNLRINPVLQEGGRPEELGLNRIHVLVRRATGAAVVDTTLRYDVASPRTYDWLIRLESEADNLEVRARVSADADSMYAGRRDVVLHQTAAGQAPVEDVELGYVGAGAEAESIRIAPRDSVVTFGDSVRYRVTGTDGEGRPVTDLVVFWDTSDDELAAVGKDGWLEAPYTRAGLYVVATTPDNLVDSTTVTFAPLPTRVIALEGDADTVRVAAALPLAVQVLADDGLGVPGVPVTFAAPAGAAVADVLVLSDADGVARTSATLGTKPGEYAFSATARGFSPTPLRAVALAGPPARLRFGVAPEFAIVNRVITPALEVRVSDAFDNLATDAGTVVTLLFGANPGDARLEGATAVAAVGGVATFGDLQIDAVGNGYTLRATADGLEDATSAPFDVTPAIAAIRVTPEVVTLDALGATQQLAATALDENGDPIPDVRFGWGSADDDVAGVDAAGVVTAVANGAVAVTATAGGVIGRADVTVAQAVRDVVVTPAAVTLTALGQTAQFTAEPRDANGHLVADAVVVWASGDEGVATIDDAGLATAVANGATDVTASAGGVSDRGALTVDQEAVEVQVAPDFVALVAIGETAQLTATARDANGHPVADAEVTWASLSEGIAAVDATGLVTAVANGEARVTASVDAATGGATVRVMQEVAEVEVTPAIVTLTALGQTRQLTAVARDALGVPVSGVTFTWSTSDRTTVSVDVAGLVTAVANGDAQVTASAGGASDHATVSVSQVVAAVDVAPAAAELTALDATVRLTAEARDANGHAVPHASFAWSSSDDAVAAVDATGLVTAVGNGDAVVAAVADGVRGEADVTVAQEVTEVVVTPEAVVLTALEQTVELDAEARDANGHAVVDAEFTWSSAAAAVATVDAAGLVTARANGDAAITARSAGVDGVAAVTVAQEAASVTVTPEAATLTALEETVALAAQGQDANGHPIAGAVFDWTSSDAAVATVSLAGVVTAVANGDASVSAALDGVSDAAVVTVSQVVTAIEVTPLDATLEALMATVQLTAAGADANGHPVADASFTWTSSDETVATVDETGLVTAVDNGAADITAAAGDGSGDARVTVAQVVTEVAVEPSEVKLVGLGATAQLHAEARDANGHEVVEADFVWASSNPAAALVDQTGLVSGVADGEATVSATAGGHTGSAHVVVQIPLEIAIDVKPGSDDNPINLGSKGVTPVAILTTSTSAGEAITFDAADADPVTVRFAGAAAQHWAPEDVDGDGDVDMIFHFPTEDLDLDEGDTAAELWGSTFGGQPFFGWDRVQPKN